jgi:hypothetical protein
MSEISGALPFIDKKLNIIICKKNLTERENLQLLSDIIHPSQGKTISNPNRKWKNSICIWGDTSCIMTTDTQQKEVLKYVDFLRLGIEKLLFPEIFFGQKMIDHLIRRTHSNETFERSLAIFGLYKNQSTCSVCRFDDHNTTPTL